MKKYDNLEVVDLIKQEGFDYTFSYYLEVYMIEDDNLRDAVKEYLRAKERICKILNINPEEV